MADINPALMMILSNSDVVGEALVHDDTQPSEAQYAIKTGDKAILASGNAGFDSTMTAGEVLDPEEYKLLFPDWEERVLNGYLLMKWSSVEDADGDVGWFSRVKLVAITDENYEEMLSWFRDVTNVPDDMPEWVNAAFETYTSTLSQLSPDSMPVLIACKKCGRKDTGIMIEHSIVMITRAGTFLSHPDWAVPMSDPRSECATKATVVCLHEDCDWTEDVPEGNLRVPRNHKVMDVMHDHPHAH